MTSPTQGAAGLVVMAAALLGAASGGAVAADPSLESVEPKQVFVDEAATLTLAGSALQDGASVALLDGGPYVIGSIPSARQGGGPVARIDARHVALGQFQEVQVIDVSDPRHPVVRATVPGPRSPRDMASEAGLLAVTGEFPSKVWLYDVTRPAEPRGLGTLTVPFDADRVALSGGVLYVGSYISFFSYCQEGALTAFSMADPSAPVTLLALPLTGCVRELDVRGRVAWLVTQEDSGEGVLRLTALDVSNPAAPVELSRTEWTNYDPEDWTGFALDGTTGFVVQEYPRTLRSLDLSDPSAPRLLHEEQEFRGGLFRHAIADRGRLFLDLEGLQLFDVRRPAAPRRLSTTLSFGVRGFAVDGDRVYASSDSDSGGFSIVDASAPERPGAIRTFPDLNGRAGVASGTDVFALDPYGQVRIQDWSDPDAPREVATVPGAGYAVALAVDGNRLFVSDVSGKRIVAYDVTVPSQPVLLGGIGGIYGHDLAAANGFVYVLDLLADSLLVIDARDPAAMRVASSVPFGPLYDWTVALSPDGSRAYVLTSPSYLVGPIYFFVLGLADPFSPTYDGVAEWLGKGGGIVVDGTEVWVADRSAGVIRIGAADPANLVVSEVIPGIPASGLARVGPYLAVTVGGDSFSLNSLDVYDVSRADGPRLTERHPTDGLMFGLLPLGDSLVLAGAGVNATTVQPALPDLRRTGDRTGTTGLPPGRVPGPYDVQLVNPDGGLSRLHNALFVCERRPLASALSPELPSPPPLRPPLRWRLTVDADPALEGGEAVGLFPALGDDPVVGFEASAGADTIRISIPYGGGPASVILSGTDEGRIRAAWGAAEARGGVLLERLAGQEYGDVRLSVRSIPTRREPRRYTFVLNGGFLDEAAAVGPGADLLFEFRARDAIGCRYTTRSSYVETLREFCASAPGRLTCG